MKLLGSDALKKQLGYMKKSSYVDTEFYFLRPLNFFVCLFDSFERQDFSNYYGLILSFIPSTVQLIYFHLVVEINIKLDIVLCSGGYNHRDSTVTLSVRIPKS